MHINVIIFSDTQDIDFLMIIYTAAYFYIPFHITCSSVLLLTKSLIYFTSLNHYPFF